MVQFAPDYRESRTHGPWSGVTQRASLGHRIKGTTHQWNPDNIFSVFTLATASAGRLMSWQQLPWLQCLLSGLPLLIASFNFPGTKTECSLCHKLFTRAIPPLSTLRSPSLHICSGFKNIQLFASGVWDLIFLKMRTVNIMVWASAVFLHTFNKPLLYNLF